MKYIFPGFSIRQVVVFMIETSVVTAGLLVVVGMMILFMYAS